MKLSCFLNLSGVHLLVLIPYNFSWTIDLSFSELTQEKLRIRGSATASFIVAFIFFGYTSSIYHLMFMGIERFYAIVKPMSYRMQQKQSVIVGLFVVWIFSIASCSVPRKYIYFLQALVFLFCFIISFQVKKLFETIECMTLTVKFGNTTTNLS